MLLTATSTLYVLISKNVLHAAFSLLLTFICVAGLFVFGGADFIGMAQILVYIGGILVLIIFGVMLTNQKAGQSEEPNNVITENNHTILGVVIAIITFSILIFVFRNTHFEEIQNKLYYTEVIDSKPTTRKIGLSLLTDNVLPFEISGILLMVSLIGSAYLSKKNKHN
ncbi:MAG: NADH-quinone oxidoreductase subunit J [Pseudarcicella sp.]|nr:NADH-quinone oxidoreductase subunit J [Pseudarcicella sp.]